MGPRDRAPKPSGSPTVHRFEVYARDRGEAVVVARDLAWEKGLRVVGDARVTLVRSRAEGHQFVVAVPCLEPE